MSHIFVYEFITAGGMWWLGEAPPTGSLLTEGRAMRNAILADFLKVAGVSLMTLVDPRVGLGDLPATDRLESWMVSSQAEHDGQFAACAQRADAVLLIAPELDGILTRLAQQVEGLPRRLLSPDVSFIQLASHKQATVQHLAARNVPVPETHRITHPEELHRLPTNRKWVAKPMDGAGSDRLRWCDASASTAWLDGITPWCVQEFVPGRAASVAGILAGSRRVLLPPMWQDVEGPSFAYRGGSRIEHPDEVARAAKLAGLAFDALPPTRGYVGIDLVLGDATDGSEDRVLEVNPRLTTSYVGLRQLTTDNLAGAMVEASCGRVVGLSFANHSLSFEADGTLRKA